MVAHVRDRILFLFSVAVVALSTISYYLSQASDPARCRVLLNDGFWLDPSQLSFWQPSGCMLHSYQPREAGSCLKDRRLVMVGGTSTLGLFESVAKMFDETYQLPFLNKGANVLYSARSVRLEFIWDPYLEGAELKAIRAGSQNERSRPALTVIGLERDYLKKDADVAAWTSQVDSLMSDFGRNGAIKSLQSDHVLFTPLQEPTISRLSPSPVDVLNDVLAGLSRKYGVDVAFAFNKIISAKDAFIESKWVAPKAGTAMAKVIMNYACNRALPKHYPFASTCCNDYPRLSWVQILGFLFIAIAIPASYLLHRSGVIRGATVKFMQWTPDPKYHRSILTMGAVVILCWYCDRTNVFGKEHKQTSPAQFFVLLGLIIVVSSILTTHTAEKDLSFLNRDQTDEWKGWMQMAILVYHYVGTSKTEYIYNYMRVMPTSYLFMTGYGHANYYLKKDDYSFKRFTATMLRLNLLNVILAYAMGNDWLLYYFAPLVTWNYFVILASLYPFRKYNKNIPFLIAKIVVVGALNTAFYRIPGILEAVWWVLQTVFRMQGDMKEWRFRVMLDAYSALLGMMTGIIFINWGRYTLPNSQHWPYLKNIAVGLSIVIMLGYAVFESSQPSKQIYNEKHTYVSWLPCCAFVIIRNCSPYLRRTHNKFFAWVGRGSLETFLLQFHIWLAADTAGLLTVGLIPAKWRFLNFIIMTPFFFFVSSLATTATGDVIQWIMGGADAKPPHTTLPTAHKPQSTGVAFDDIAKEGGITVADAKVPTPLSSIPESAIVEIVEEVIPSSVPVNGQPVDIKIQDPASLERGIVAIEEGHTDRTMVLNTLWGARGDLRIRIGAILLVMAFMNWTYYI